MAPKRVERRRDGRSHASDGRSRGGAEWIYGRNAVQESLKAGRRTFHLLRLAAAMPPSEAVDEIRRLAEAKSVPIEVVARGILDELTAGANHQGAALACGPYPYLRLPETLERGKASGEVPFVLVLDSLQDPQNVGTLLRTAEAVGVTTVILPEHRAAGITPAAVNASSGAVEHLRIARESNLARAIGVLKNAGVWVIALEAADGAQILWDVPLTGPLALVVGSEGHGVRRLVMEECDFTARLPLLGRVESLNAAVAGSVALYEALRARTASGAPAP